MSRYSIKQMGVDNDFIDYVGSTTITGIPDKPMLKQWAVDKAIEYIKENWDVDVNCDKLTMDERSEYYKDYDNMLNQARYAHKTYLNQTADIGSELHKIVEAFINIKISMYDVQETMFEGKITQEMYFLDYVSKQKYNLKQMFYQFYNWQKKKVKKFIESEKPVCHKELCAAGTCDFLYQGFNDKIYMTDLKTTSFKPYKNKKTNKIDYKLKAHYPEHEIQDSFYCKARENMSGKYKVRFNQYNNNWTKVFNYKKVKIDGCKILYIERDFFNLYCHNVKDIENRQECFESLLTYYYKVSKRQMNNYRAINQV